jgi:hypothetical protein
MEGQMPEIMSACGVLCSDCPAYLGNLKGVAHQAATADAWFRIYGRSEKAEVITCGGCLGPDDAVFYTSLRCTARKCCRSKAFTSCAECGVRPCPALERAQSVWDGVPKLAATLAEADFITYAQPYCGHRHRLAAARARMTRTGAGDNRTA